MSAIETVLTDLASEAAELMTVLDGLDEDGWTTPTPAPGWTIHDQVCHLAHFDWVTRLAITAPAQFVRLRDAVAGAPVGHGPGLQDYVDSIGPANASRTGADVLDWWRVQNRLLREAVAALPVGERIAWFGPTMSPTSKVTARLMETWAHGQDIVDALGIVRPPTDRLRHVARIGVLAMPHSFTTHDRPAPDAPVHVGLTLPSGETVAWGERDEIDSVTGPALDFCLVVTRRRHVADTALRVTGPAAAAWMDIAQAFAGPPGAGRLEGQFA
jgi:uncharacterized protein (TIGR03084 family)